MRFAYTLPGGKKVEIQEIGPEDELAAFTIAGELDSAVGKIRLSHDLLRRAIVSVDGVPKTWSDLEGNKLYRAFEGNEFKLVQLANDKHNGPPAKDEQTAFFASLERKV